MNKKRKDKEEMDVREKNTYKRISETKNRVRNT